MTVTKLGHKLDDLTEVMDVLHNDVLEIKSAIKSLVEIQKEIIKSTLKSKETSETPESDFTMYG
tara:strand:- start:113 stop:304 length:192 start_codon:yes stop_codon:yes gene_type:complete